MTAASGCSRNRKGVISMADKSSKKNSTSGYKSGSANIFEWANMTIDMVGGKVKPDKPTKKK